MSSPLRTSKLKVPLPESIPVTSQRTLSDEPLTNEPLVDTLPELFIIAPWEIVSSVNEEESACIKDLILAVAGAKEPEATLVTKAVSPPCWK